MMNSENYRRLRAFALPTVLVVSLLIQLLIMAAYFAFSLNVQRYSLYHRKKQLREDLKSALVLYCADSTLCMAEDSVEINLFNRTDSVLVKVGRWGMYESVKLSNKYPDTYNVLVGRKSENNAKAAFWLCDRNRALSLAGDAMIEGLVYMPLSGINYTEVCSKYYTGKPITENMLRVSTVDLPAVDSMQLKYARQLCNMNASIVELSASVRDSIISGSTVRVKSGFKGSMQIFASDTVIIDDGAILEYPSGIYVDSGDRWPYVILKHGAEVNGYVIVISSNSDSQLRYPSYVQQSGAILNGLLYVNGSCSLNGVVRGAAYVKDCYYSFGENIYAGQLFDTRIMRSDSLAFPIFMEGPYQRKAIKKVCQL